MTYLLTVQTQAFSTIFLHCSNLCTFREGMDKGGHGPLGLNSPMSSEKSNDSNDGLNGSIKQEPDPQPSQSSLYADLQKAMPGATIMQGIDMQTSNTHNSHPQHPVVSLNNGSAHHHHDMGHILSEYQHLWNKICERRWLDFAELKRWLNLQTVYQRFIKSHRVIDNSKYCHV